MESDKRSIVYAIQDEEGSYVHGDSIRKVGKDYYYLSYKGLKDGCIVYTSEERVKKAMEKLILHNQKGRLNHIFSIISFNY